MRHSRTGFTGLRSCRAPAIAITFQIFESLGHIKTWTHLTPGDNCIPRNPDTWRRLEVLPEAPAGLRHRLDGRGLDLQRDIHTPLNRPSHPVVRGLFPQSHFSYLRVGRCARGRRPRGSVRRCVAFACSSAPQKRPAAAPLPRSSQSVGLFDFQESYIFVENYIFVERYIFVENIFL